MRAVAAKVDHAIGQDVVAHAAFVIRGIDELSPTNPHRWRERRRVDIPVERPGHRAIDREAVRSFAGRAPMRDAIHCIAEL